MLAAAGSGVGVPPAAAHTASESTIILDASDCHSYHMDASPGAQGMRLGQPAAGRTGPVDALWVLTYVQKDGPNKILDKQRPVRLEVEAESQDGEGNPEQGGLYFVGLYNFTRNAIEWFGPYSANASIVMNDATHRDSYLCGSNSVADWRRGAFCIDIARGDDLLGVAPCIKSIAVTVNSTTLPCNPHYVPDLAASAGASGITLTWTHVAALGPEDEQNTAVSYEIWRKVSTPLPAVRELLGTVDAPTATYLDATAAPGTPYVYYVRAVNASGGTSTFSEWAVATVPE